MLYIGTVEKAKYMFSSLCVKIPPPFSPPPLLSTSTPLFSPLLLLISIYIYLSITTSFAFAITWSTKTLS